MKTHILVISDNKPTQTIFKNALQYAGYKVYVSEYANMKLWNLVLHQPDLVILDFSLADGGEMWQFLQLLKMEETTAAIPILITATALQLSAEMQTYLLTQYISVIHKPFDLNMLILLIQQTLTDASQAGVIFTSSHKLPILVVDDTEDLRDATIEVLRLEGYQVVSATNGMLALDAVSRAEHCLILLDIAMPIMNGFEFLTAYNRQLRPHSPVIILSGEQNIQTELFPPFVVDLVSKPFEVHHLLNLVGKYAPRDMDARV